jgi:hypothetical protein
MNTINNIQQRTDEWLKCRLGVLTGSEIGKLMKSSRKKDELFGDTAKGYIYKKAAERDLLDEVKSDEEIWEIYKNQYSFSSKAIDFGTEQEAYARDLYSKLTGRRIVEVGLCKHPTIPNFASSPDGLFYDEGTGERGCLEIKVPNIDTYVKYLSEITNTYDLLIVNPDYYYQCLSHMACCEAQWTDFVCYQPFLKHNIHIVRILPDEKVFAEMEKRIRMADDIINQIADIE